VFGGEQRNNAGTVNKPHFDREINKMSSKQTPSTLTAQSDTLISHGLDPQMLASVRQLLSDVQFEAYCTGRMFEFAWTAAAQLDPPETWFVAD
jgi:hypothetical protein